METSFLKVKNTQFRTGAAVHPLLQQICRENADLAACEQIGVSEEGRPIAGVVMGKGARRVSLIAGAHSDEPVGPETLRTLIIEGLKQRDLLGDWFEQFQFVIVPHINPDGEARNQNWIAKWPDVEAYLLNAFREPPGRDLEFGFPNMRVENKCVSEFLQLHAPFALHASLHGMGFAEGAMLLIERRWIDKTQTLREQFKQAVRAAGLRLHDHDRKGEKGFHYIEPGFWTTPEGSAMRNFFSAKPMRSSGEGKNDSTTAQLFHDSSMEFVRTLGGDPLCLVTELPLFVINKEILPRKPGAPQAYLEFAEKIPALRSELLAGRSVQPILDSFQIQPFSLNAAVPLQLKVIELGLQTVSGSP
jgi:hypothetical protein